MLIGNRTHNLVITSDGKKALVSTCSRLRRSCGGPGQGRFERKVELTGCATMLTNTINTSRIMLQRHHGDGGDGRAAPASPVGAFFKRHRRPDLRYSILDAKTGQGDLVELSRLDHNP